MGRQELELVEKLQALVPADNMKSLVDDDSVRASLSGLFDPQAEVRFVDVEGGVLGDAVPRARGIEGLREGWREWLEPWDDFRVRFEHVFDAGEGKVLSLAELRGRTGDGSEISHPGAALIQVREGRVSAIYFYMDREQARRDAGLA